MIFTIDPESAKDLDDALSLEKLQDDLFEIGIHIADVSHFVEQNTAIDLDAQQRCTSCYLPHRVIKMLPDVLTENLCSLTTGKNRFAFSVLVQINSLGIIQSKPRFCKSIINSCAKLSYITVQDIIDKKIINSS